MNKLKNIVKMLLGVVLIMLVMTGGSTAKAVSAGDKCYAERAEKGFYTIQSWNGSEWIYVTYSITNYVDEYGKKRVAYCVNPDRKGIGYISGEYSGYDVEIKNIINDERAWRVLSNGYPYKSPADLGVETEQDAYLATKMALYAMLRNNCSDDIRRMYRAGEDRIAGQDMEETKRRGIKVIEAICKLVDIGNNGNTKMQFNGCVKLSKVGKFESFGKEEQYYVQRMKVSSTAECMQYDVRGVKGFPEGSRITDIKGVEKTTFKGGDEFYIMVPKSTLMEDFKGHVEVTASVKNYPMYYAECVEENLQNYYLCCDECSKSNVASCDVDIKISKSKLHIEKIDNDSKQPIAGVKFSVKYMDGTDIGTYATDNDGKILIEGLHQGKIAIKEISCDERYQLDPEEKIINIDYGDDVSIVIENEMKKDEEKVEEKLPRTGETGAESMLGMLSFFFALLAKKIYYK